MTGPTIRRHRVTVHTFSQRFYAIPLGVRLARRHARLRLDRWGIPFGSESSDAAALIVAELAANAVAHTGATPGAEFALRLMLQPGALRIEVTDAAGSVRPPEPGDLGAPDDEAESGRGLILVAALADRWSVLDAPAGGKTVRVELDLPVDTGVNPGPLL
ncbi:ATP-binding protein [Streptomyces uncialis]|uniref:ATP-binding protein n=1 Tax=Streptomyces uncialis TaxID=1048205 RepID=UPI003865C8DD|nr:ATP-binding protein [Streptomyces uncialis]